MTINLPRIAYLASNEADFYERLDKMMDISARSLKIKRNVVTKLFNEGLYPYTKRYLTNFDNHFSTIGLIGMNEATLNAKWLRKDISEPQAHVFAKDVLNHMRDRLSDYQEEYGDLYNLEATPAESTTYRLAMHDIKDYPEIITADKNGEKPYYTNSSNLPVGFTDDVFEALENQNDLQTLYTSGTVFHAFVGEKLPSWKSAANLVRKIAEHSKLPYYTISPTYSICKNHGYINGEAYVCEQCGEATEVYSRITGYYRPVQNWNEGKTQEFEDRKLYAIEKTVGLTVDISDRSQVAESDEILDEIIEEANRLLLFTTARCPNCTTAKSFLKQANIAYEIVEVEKNTEMVSNYAIRSAPTLVVQNGEKWNTYVNASNIRSFAESHAALKG